MSEKLVTDEEELMNQAKVMEAHRRSSDTGKRVHLEELN